MTLGELSHDDVRGRLAAGRLRFGIGQFNVALRSVLPSVERGLVALYGDYPVLDDDDLSDFCVELRASGGIRRWVRRQVVFSFDGHVPFKPLPQSQAFAMFEWGLNWCISNHAHQNLIVHAAVVARDDRALILPGMPGSGKSTLCAALVSRGWRLLSDEMALISLATGRLLPVPRPISLKNASIGVMRRFAPEAVFGETVHETAKGSVAHMRPPRESVLSATRAADPAAIVFPRYQAGAPLALSEITPGRALLKVAENAFNYNVLGAEGFELLADTLERCVCHELVYQDLDAAVAAMERVVEGR